MHLITHYKLDDKLLHFHVHSSLWTLILKQKGRKVAIQNVLCASSDEWHFRVVLALILVVFNLLSSVFRLMVFHVWEYNFFERFWWCEIIYLKHFQWHHIIPWPLQHMFVELINFENLILKYDISPNIQLDSLFSFIFFWGNFQHFENKIINVDLAQILIGNKKMACCYY